MTFTSFVARRYLRATRHDLFFSWITALSILGISLGIAALILVLSVINGFETELRDRFLAANAHILAYRYPSGMDDYREWQDTLMRDFAKDLTGVSPFVYSDTMGRKGYAVNTILVRGIRPRDRQSVQDLSHYIYPKEALNLLNEPHRSLGSDDYQPIIIGIGLSKSMEAQIDDVIEIIAPSENADTGFSQLKDFRVVGYYDSGLDHYDQKLGILSLEDAQELFGMGHKVTGLEIGLKRPNESQKIAHEIETRYSRDRYVFSVREWQSYNKNIFDAIVVEKAVIAVIVAMVAFVASFNIFTTLFILVTKKRKDIAILKALGASNRQILLIFIKQSVSIGLLGSVIGVILALILAYCLETFPFFDFPSSYHLTKLPVEYDPWVYLGISFMGVLISAIAGLYPAWSATLITPTEGLRGTDTAVIKEAH